MHPPVSPASHAIRAAQPNTFSTAFAIRIPGLFLKSCVGAAMLCLALQALAADPAPAGSTTVAPAAQETSPPAASAASPSPATPQNDTRFDWSKVPPVTTPSRPGMFTIAPSGPGYYSVWDHVSGNKRQTPPVSPYAPYALMTTPAFDIDFRYLEKPKHEKDICDPIKRIRIGEDFVLSLRVN